MNPPEEPKFEIPPAPYFEGRRCPNCGAGVPLTEKYCPNCAYSFVRPNPWLVALAIILFSCLGIPAALLSACSLLIFSGPSGSKAFFGGTLMVFAGSAAIFLALLWFLIWAVRKR